MQKVEMRIKGEGLGLEDWTEPYYGVQHYNKVVDGRRATISDYGRFVDVAMWFPGCGFSPIKKTVPNIEKAMAAGEQWVNKGVSECEEGVSPAPKIVEESK